MNILPPLSDFQPPAKEEKDNSVAIFAFRDSAQAVALDIPIQSMIVDSPILEEILRERNRQYQKWGHTDFESVARFVLSERNLPTDLPPAVLQFLGLRTMEVVLNEEVGEVSRAILEGDLAGLEKELIQVAAVAVAMVEYLRKH